VGLHAQPRVVAAQTQVAVCEQVECRAEHMAARRADHRVHATHERGCGRPHRCVDRSSVGFGHRAVGQRAHVVAGRERRISGASQHDHPHPRFFGEPVQRLRDPAQDLDGQHVPPGQPAQRDRGDRPVSFDEQVIGHHTGGCSSRSGRIRSDRSVLESIRSSASNIRPDASGASRPSVQPRNFSRRCAAVIGLRASSSIASSYWCSPARPGLAGRSANPRDRTRNATRFFDTVSAQHEPALDADDVCTAAARQTVCHLR